MLTAREYQVLADVPPEAKWLTNLDSVGTKRICRIDIREFMTFVGIRAAADFQTVTCAHVIAWRDELQERALAGATIRRKLTGLSSLFEQLCDSNSITHNPAKGVKRPKAESYDGKTPAPAAHQVRALPAAPQGDSLKAKRDRAILSVPFSNAL